MCTVSVLSESWSVRSKKGGRVVVNQEGKEGWGRWWWWTYSFFLRTGKVGTNFIFADPPRVVVARFPIAFDGGCGGGGGPVFGGPDPEGSDILRVSRFWFWFCSRIRKRKVGRERRRGRRRKREILSFKFWKFCAHTRSNSKKSRGDLLPNLRLRKRRSKWSGIYQ